MVKTHCFLLIINDKICQELENFSAKLNSISLIFHFLKFFMLFKGKKPLPPRR